MTNEKNDEGRRTEDGRMTKDEGRRINFSTLLEEINSFLIPPGLVMSQSLSTCNKYYRSNSPHDYNNVWRNIVPENSACLTNWGHETLNKYLWI